MKHYGDITKLSGYVLPIVDVITGGSPCQDLSVAGKRAGLAGERSGLFMEQMRIVKEMRERDVRDGRPAQYVRPRYMVWENVPGAFSSGNPKGSDFQAVLEEIVRVVCKEAPPVPIPEEGWPKAGCISGVGDSGCTFSIAWRVHDAQFWGVPQRRKRIALVADFGGLSAPEILFERKGLSGDSEPCGAAREGTPRAIGNRVGKASAFTYRGRENGCNVEMQDELAYSLRNPSGGGSQPNVLITSGNCTAGGDCVHKEYAPALTTDRPHAVCKTISFQERAGKPGGGKRILIQHEHVGALSTLNNQPLVVGINGQIAGTLDSNYFKGCGERQGVEREVVCVGNGQLNQMSMAEQANTLDTMHDQQAVLIAMASTAVHAEITTDGVSPSLLARAGTGGNNMPNITRGSTVRRLTPLECERLQGYPDGWTDIGEWVDSKGKKHKEADSPRYKALGNSIALPFWQFLARRICAQYERTVTMASLFDGIGGFPLVFERCGAKAVWASEIEEFPIAVTKKHFPEEDTK